MRRAGALFGFVVVATVAILLAGHVGPGAAGVVVLLAGGALLALGATGRL